MPKNRGERPPESFAVPGDGITQSIPSIPNDSRDGASRSRQGSSFAARFGRVILKHGVAAIPSALYHFQGRLGLSAQQVWFTSYILSHKWDEDLPYPSIAQMARCTGISDRMLRYRCNELHHLGYLEIYPRYAENGGQSTNYFDFARLFARLEEIISGEAPLPNPIREALGAPTPLTASTPLTAPATPVAPAEYSQGDSSFLARYGRVILSYGVAAVPRALFTHQKALGVTAQQVWFICYVLSFQWDAALPYPSINKMAERTGYSKQQLHTIKGELIAKGYLQIEHRTAMGGGTDTNLYDFSALFDAIRAHLEPNEPRATDRETHNEGEPLAEGLEEAGETSGTPGVTALRRHRPSQPKHARYAPGVAEVGGEEADPAPGSAMELTRGPAMKFTWATATELSTPAAMKLTRRAATELSYPDNQASPVPLHLTLPTGRKGSLPKEEAIQTEESNRDDSNHPSQKNKSVTGETKTAIPGYSPYIAAIASDFSRELGDAAHEASNMRQALNVWKSSGLDEEEFISLMHEARKLTRKYQSRPTWDAMHNKMAYYFTTLSDLVGQQAKESDE